MNTLEQILKKRIERRDMQIRVLLDAVNAASDEIDTLSSLACSFAYDLAAAYPEAGDRMLNVWQEAIRTAMEEDSK